MKLSLSCRIAESFLSKEKAMMSLEELCDLAVQAGYQSICMRPSQLSIDSSEDKIRRACKTIRQRQLNVSMISGDIHVVYNNDRGPNCLNDIEAHLNLADSLGASLIRVCIKTSDELVAARRAANQAADRGMTLVHQCHVQSPFETIDQIERCLQEIDHPNFGLIFEAANLEECRQDYGPATIARLAPWIRNVYLQNQRLSTTGAITLDTWTHGPVSFDIIDIPEPEGINFQSVISGLHQVGYDGIVTVHQSAPQDGTSCLDSASRTADYLQKMI